MSIFEKHPIRIALYQPDIPGNTGTLLRMAACLDVPLDIIEPAGFRLDDKNLKRAGMDYLELAMLTRHRSWDVFEEWRKAEGHRLILLTTKANDNYTEFEYQAGDILLFGRESLGVPDNVHETVDHRLTIKMNKEARSLNLALSAAMVTGEALRQTIAPS
jgi:tRNA (cytidine/uridine-2'-O-)-methyltransferase